MELKFNRFFGPFRSELREQLRELVLIKEYEEDTFLFLEDDPANDVYLVLEGEVQLVKFTKNRPEELIARVGAGDYFGEVGVLDGSGRSTAAKAMSGSRIGSIPADPLVNLLLNEPGSVTMRFFQRITDHLRSTNERFMREVVQKEKMTMVGEMAGLIIHDFKSPINGIQLAIDLIRNKHDDEMTTRFCGMIRQQAKRMLDMAQELLDFSQGTPRLHREPMAVKALLSQFVELNEFILNESGVELRVEACDATIDIDPGRMLRVLQNLLVNAFEALRHQEEGRVDILARISGPPEDPCLVIEVRDNGPGIPADLRQTLFEPFVTAGKAKGTGLGLPIAKTFVVAHEGFLDYETSGKGTTFSIRLPLADPVVTGRAEIPAA